MSDSAEVSPGKRPMTFVRRACAAQRDLVIGQVAEIKDLSPEPARERARVQDLDLVEPEVAAYPDGSFFDSPLVPVVPAVVGHGSSRLALAKSWIRGPHEADQHLGIVGFQILVRA